MTTNQYPLYVSPSMAARERRSEKERSQLAARATAQPTREQRSFWFTVCGPNHAWLKTYTGHTHHDSHIGSVRKAKDDARDMCRSRRANGLGEHFIEVREIPTLARIRAGLANRDAEQPVLAILRA